MFRNRHLQQPCPVCSNPMSKFPPPLDDCEVVDCPSCGKMRLTGTATRVIAMRRSAPTFMEALQSLIFKRQLALAQEDWLLIDSNLLRDAAELAHLTAQRRRSLTDRRTSSR